MLAMKENYELIYLSESVKTVQQEIIKPMFAKVFGLGITCTVLNILGKMR